MLLCSLLLVRSWEISRNFYKICIFSEKLGYFVDPWIFPQQLFFGFFSSGGMNKIKKTCKVNQNLFSMSRVCGVIFKIAFKNLNKLMFYLVFIGIITFKTSRVIKLWQRIRSPYRIESSVCLTTKSQIIKIIFFLWFSLFFFWCDAIVNRFFF